MCNVIRGHLLQQQRPLYLQPKDVNGNYPWMKQQCASQAEQAAQAAQAEHAEQAIAQGGMPKESKGVKRRADVQDGGQRRVKRKAAPPVVESIDTARQSMLYVMSGRGKARTEKTVKKKVNKKAGKSVSEEVDWQASLNSQRNGASYFTALANVLHAAPRGYFEHRLITTESKESIIQEWEGWMGFFLQSEFQVLRDIGAQVHNVDDDARSVLASRIVKNHKVNLLQESSEQVHIASKELTAMVRNGAEFAAIVEPLVVMAEFAAKTDTGVKAQPIISRIYELQGAPGSEPHRRSLDALKTILKHAERPLSGRTKDSSEGDAVSLWSAIFREQLPATACLALNLQSNVHLLEIYDIVAGTRKCNTILTVEDLEVANFELKEALCTDVKDDIQLRRTIKAMKSIRMEATVFSMKELDDIWFLFDRYSRDVLVKKAEYEQQLRRGKTAVLPLSSQEKESKDLEWDLLVLNTPAKKAGRGKSILDQLEDDDEESAPSSPSDRYSIALEKKDDEVNTASKSRSNLRKPKAFRDRLRDAMDDEADELADSDTC
ncbi:hypothetical protein EDD11_005590 [Mortierella claussenii]|nr:hypothetical protein EDD11_005590 [Mortierella claussenii]